MRNFVATAFLIAMLGLCGCGLAYQAASAHRATKMDETLKPGMSMPEVHEMFGEPDLRAYPDQRTEIWSYAKHANTNDVTAEILYTSAKEGDRGTFIDLIFRNGTLASWNEAKHTMPVKKGSGFGMGMGLGPTFQPQHY